MSWIVETEGKRIFHAGDLSNWYARFLPDAVPGQTIYSEEFEEYIDPIAHEKQFLGELKDIRKVADGFDLVMFPVDGRIGNGYTLGGRQFIERFKVGLFVPMHFTASGFESAWRMKEFTDERNIRFWEIAREGETIEINVKGAESALQKAVECGATVLYPSTVEVYGNARGEDVFYEDYTGQLNLNTARSCYTESKRVSEALCQSYMAERGVNVKLVRLSRIFGPTMLVSDSKASSQFIIKALSGENIVLKSKGEQFFSYTYVADAVCAMLHVLINGEYGVPYNVSSEKCNVHLKDFARKCAEWAGKQVVFDLPSETERKGFSVAMQAILDNQRLKETDWSSIYDFEAAINRTLNILR